MPRTKVKSAIISERQVNDVLRQIGELDLRLEAIEARGQKIINRAKQEMEQDGVTLIEQKKVLELQLKSWAEDKYKDGAFGKDKTKKFQFGEISFRQSTSITTLKGFTTERAIDLLRARGHEDCIRITEALDKDTIRALDWEAESLSAFGLQAKSKDTFGYKIDREHLIVTDDIPAGQQKTA